MLGLFLCFVLSTLDFSADHDYSVLEEAERTAGGSKYYFIFTLYT